MIGITIASPEYRDMAVQAVESFQKMTGCNALIYFDAKPRNYAVKLNLGRLFPGQKQTICFFDADTLWVKPTDLRPFENKDEFFAVADCEFTPAKAGEPPSYDSFAVRDCETHGLDHTKYFNSGFFIFNDRHLGVFDRAKELLLAKKFHDFGEQSSLNYAVQETETPLTLLPEGYNFLPASRKSSAEWPSDVRLLHVGGYHGDSKHEALRLCRDTLLRRDLKIQ